MNPLGSAIIWLSTNETLYGPSGTAIVAALVGVVTLQQQRVSRSKLRLDLYEKRFEVYQIVTRSLTKVVSYKPNDNRLEIFYDIERASASAQYLFLPSDGIGELIYRIKDKVRELMDIVDKQDRIKNVSTVTLGELDKLYDATNIEARGLLRDMEDKLKKYLAFYKA